MRALGLWQPYASLIALRIKTLETRPWACLPGLVLICSTKKLAPNYIELCDKYGIHETPTGVMICVVNITHCRPCIQSDSYAACAPCENKFGFELGPPTIVEPIPVKCGQK